MSWSFGSTSTADPLIISEVKLKIGTSKIFVISKINCRACLQAKALLYSLVSKTGTRPSVLEVDNFSRKSRLLIMNYLLRKTGVNTFPQIWIKGNFIGGNDDVQRLHQEGGLIALIRGTTRKSGSFKRDLLAYIPSLFGISSKKVDVFPQVNTETSSGNYTTTIPMGNTRGHTRSKVRMSMFDPTDQNTTNKDKDWSKFQVLRSQLRVRSLPYSRSMPANPVARESSRNFLIPGQRSIFSQGSETAKVSKTKIPSDDAILKRSSVFVQPKGFENYRINGGSGYALNPNWV